MKRSILLYLVPVMLIPGAVNAAEIYNKDGNKLDIYGKIDGLHYFSKDKNADGDQSYVRGGFRGETQIDNQITGYGQWEYNVQANNTEGSSNQSWTRLAFAGLKFGDAGSFDYGRNTGVVYDVTSWTDVIDFNTLTVVGRHNVAHAGEVYEFLRRNGSRYMQFIPLVERVSSEPDPTLRLVPPEIQNARLAPWSVPSKQYGEFLSQIFDIWIRRDIGHISVQMFDVAMAAWSRQPAVLCVHAETCGHAFALEANGDLYNCDHYVYPEHLLGNIHQRSIDVINNSEAAISFGLAKKLTLTDDCKVCQFRFVCQGGCPKHRFARSSSGAAGHNYLCAGYQHFFKHIQPVMNLWAALLARGCPPASLIQYLREQHRFSLRRVR